MKFTITFFLVFLALALTADGQKSQGDEFADKLVKALQKRDFAAYRRIAVDSTDIKEVFHDYSKIDGGKGARTLIDSSNKAFRMQFDKLLREGEKAGVDWSRIKKLKFRFQKAEIFAGSTKESMSGSVFFNCQERIYVLAGVSIYKLKSGLKLWSIVGVVKTDKNKMDEMLNAR